MTNQEALAWFRGCIDGIDHMEKMQGVRPMTQVREATERAIAALTRVDAQLVHETIDAALASSSASVSLDDEPTLELDQGNDNGSAFFKAEFDLSSDMGDPESLSASSYCVITGYGADESEATANLAKMLDQLRGRVWLAMAKTNKAVAR